MSQSVSQSLRKTSPPARQLDPSIWKPKSDDLEFLKKTIDEDEDEIGKRIFEIQAKAYKAYPYPCIRFFSFARLHMKRHVVYQTILEQAKAAPNSDKPKLLEIGCCMGTELRKLILDGYPSDLSSPNVIGFDLRRKFIDCGYELFQDGPDSNKMTPITFYDGDIFDKDTDLVKIQGKVNYIFTLAVFHLFGKATQEVLAERLLDILDLPKQINANAVNREYIIFGMHEGREEEQVIKDQFGNTRYGHSPGSWNRMWGEVIGKRYGVEKVRTHVKLEAHLREPVKIKDMVYREMQWSVRVSV